MQDMRENNEITGLFRSRLAGAEMEVRDGFWEELQAGLAPAAPLADSRFWHSSRFHRMAAAASVLLVLGVASAAFWYFSPKEEIREAFTQAAVLTSEGSLNSDVVQESFPSIHQTAPVAQVPGAKQPAGGSVVPLPAEEDEELSLHVSITITQRMYGNVQQPGDGGAEVAYTEGNAGNVSGAIKADEEAAAPVKGRSAGKQKQGNWSLKAAVGSSLPKDGCHMPLTLQVTAERKLNRCLSLEAGLQYNYLSGGQADVHTLGIPVKLNLLLATTPKVDFYATAGGMAEKCIAGAPDNSFRAEPVQLSASAGVGVRYKVNDRFALFAEPSVSHHFSTDSKTRTLRTERPTNLNLLCGVRMTY